MTSPPIGLALGGGAAHGLAHIPMLEALDELGVRPSLIAGTSMGAIVGAAYAAGHSGRHIAAYAREVQADRRRLWGRLWNIRPKAMRALFTPKRATAGQLEPATVLTSFADLVPATFAALSIPLRVIACDFYGWREVVLSEGSLTEAVAASMALPPILRPVMIGGRAHIDGGIVNPLPFEHATIDGGLLIAIDVVGGPVPRPGRAWPRRIETLIGSAQLTMRQVTLEKLKTYRPPDILLYPAIDRFGPMEYGKVADIFAAAQPAKEQLKRQLAALLG